jgi:hypothetical protein
MKLYPLFVGSLGNIFGSSAPNAAQCMLKALCPALENEDILGQQFWIWYFARYCFYYNFLLILDQDIECFPGHFFWQHIE